MADWEISAEIGRWDHWINLIVSWYPQIFISDANKFEDIEKWTDTRWWPNTIPILENAFVNYTKWLRALQHLLYRHSQRQEDMYFTPKFYQSSEWNEEKYDQRYKIWLAHIRLLESAAIELCKAANFIALLVRRNLDAAYRQKEGKFSIQDTFQKSGGPFPQVFEYKLDEIGDGLVYSRSELFKKIEDGEL